MIMISNKLKQNDKVNKSMHVLSAVNQLTLHQMNIGIICLLIANSQVKTITH